MTTDPKTQIAVEIQGNNRKLRRQAQQAEKQWRAERGFRCSGPLPAKPVIKRTPKPVERNEVKRREQRQQMRIDRSLLRQSSLIATTGEAGDDGPRLIKRGDT